ncbi:MAG TPA: aminoacetone oxidase family FAD-binding enzyme [Bacteroidota bacterium]|nr:aminoacetone oxidase family FAD-binding enzyme [Bacteroidota bacterium]
MLKSHKYSPVVVIGGGAAGMIAAWRAGALGAAVTLLEKNSRLGIKLLISGGGKCNITHGGEIESVCGQFRRNESIFLKHSMHRFTNHDILSRLRQFGVETYERENGRVFPTSGKAGDVVHALRRMMEKEGVEIQLSHPVEEILCDSVGISGIKTAAGFHQARQVVLATGGASYPKTGTTGEGFRWLKDLGHTIVPLSPALAPILLDPKPPAAWQGVSMRDSILKAKISGKPVASARGDLLFTHEGISGPTALEISREVFGASKGGTIADVFVDAAPDKDEGELENTVLSEITANGARSVETLVELFVPQRLAPFIVISIGVDPGKKCHQLKKEERASVVRALKSWHIGRVKEIPIERGEVTAGGVALHEVDSKTMRSRILKGLYICGEALDVAGPIGGYNLQAAFSTGYVAGETAAEDWRMNASSGESTGSSPVT